MQYDDLIKILKNNHPVASKPDELTKRIMNSTRRHEGRTLRYSQAFLGARIVLSLAAAFLIIFFIVEQHQINTKLEKLGNSIVQVKYPELLNNYHQVRYETFNQNVYDSLSYDSIKETLVINRRTLNFLLNRIKELESENISIQDKLNALYNDSLTFQKPKQ
jgi:hypothetical protein